MRVVVTGGAGFLGSHLCEALIGRGDSVVCVDDLSSGRLSNMKALEQDRSFELIVGDVSEKLDVKGHVDAVMHFASAASPPDYLARPIETLLTGSEGTRHALELAARNSARFVLASTSEVYGDPAVHPQVETYWGNVNPVGPRSVYDEAKRFAEALTTAWHTARQADTGIVRIFNTYGPRLRPGDGRVVSNFIVQALAGTPLTVYGDGSQTRSLCYVDDEVRGLIALLDSDLLGPVNIGNPHEVTVLELAERVIALTGSGSPIEFRPLPVDDPVRRCPDISVARRELGWEPAVGLDEGLSLTIRAFQSELDSDPDPDPDPGSDPDSGSDPGPGFDPGKGDSDPGKNGSDPGEGGADR
jgi:dTDP-glucose 4,6-dehydratase